MKDKTVGIISIIISIFLLFTLRDKGFETKLFPMALLATLILLGLLLVVSKKQNVYKFNNLGKILINFLFIFLYIQILPFVGFIISTTCFISTFIIFNKYPMKKIVVLTFSLLVSLIIWFIFSFLFGIALPEILF